MLLPFAKHGAAVSRPVNNISEEFQLLPCELVSPYVTLPLLARGVPYVTLPLLARWVPDVTLPLLARCSFAGCKTNYPQKYKCIFALTNTNIGFS